MKNLSVTLSSGPLRLQRFFLPHCPPPPSPTELMLQHWVRCDKRTTNKSTGKLVKEDRGVNQGEEDIVLFFEINSIKRTRVNANGRKRFLGIHYAKKITVLKTKSSAVTTTANGFQWKTISWPLLSLNQSKKFTFHYNITVYIIQKLRQLKNESVLQVLKKQLK